MIPNRLGKCPYCEDGFVSWEKKPVRGKTTKIYTCSNARWTTIDGELFELTSDATCSFRIWGNSLVKYGKKFIGPKEVKKLLNQEDVIARLYSYTAKKEYFKYITLSSEYGVSIDWETEVEDEDTLK